MSRPYKILGLIVLGALALAVNAQAQMYSQIGSTGTVVAGGFTYNAFGNAIIIDGGGSETRIVYNVTNPRDNSSSPSWTTLEILAVDGGPSSTTNARFIRVPRTTGSPESILCNFISNPDSTVRTVYSCTFSSSLIDFANYYYYVRISLTRLFTTTEFPAIYAIRVY